MQCDHLCVRCHGIALFRIFTDKSLIDSTSKNGGSLVATKIHEYTAHSLKPITQIQHIASVILNGSHYNSSAVKQMDGALNNSMEDGMRFTFTNDHFGISLHLSVAFKQFSYFDAVTG